MDKAQVVRHIVWIDVWPGVWIYYYHLYKCVGMWLLLVAIGYYVGLISGSSTQCIHSGWSTMWCVEA